MNALTTPVLRQLAMAMAALILAQAVHTLVNFPHAIEARIHMTPFVLFAFLCLFI